MGSNPTAHLTKGDDVDFTLGFLTASLLALATAAWLIWEQLRPFRHA